ncbi:MAG: SpoIID/LytB domain-containing protein [Vicinamibacteria bacterium]|jgi:stage II sporulation protein D|nr:SpoIID/LytB domain-containing protein [Vicinamibacteria bacterium]
MPKPSPRRIVLTLAGLASLAALFIVSCRSAPPMARVADAFPAVEKIVAAPIVRVAVLTDVARTSIAADSSVMTNLPAQSGARRTHARITVAFVATSQPAAQVYVQAGSYTEQAPANTVSARIARSTQLKATVKWNTEARVHQVRVGPWPTRAEAAGHLERLVQSGVQGAFIVEEINPGQLSIAETGEQASSVIVIPSKTSETLSVDGVAYRGIIEVRAQGGGLTVINIVHMEDYLRGVVPNELSPQVYPQSEAQKAQAIAARSYAMRNLGQFKARGYDLCATAACQVYRGVASEQALSDQAVQETRGQVASYRGEVINALYTSTCGGHTEDADSIFAGERAPYLKGVICAPERAAWRRLTAVMAPAAGSGALARDLSLLSALGIASPNDLQSATLKGVPSDAEIVTWTRKLLSALKRPSGTATINAGLARRDAFYLHLVEHLDWIERAERMVSAEDVDYLVQASDAAELTDERTRRAVAILLQEKIIAPFEDNSLRPAGSLTRGEALSILAKVAQNASPLIRKGEFSDLQDDDLLITLDGQIEKYSLDRSLRLVRNLDGAITPAAELFVAPGEQVRFVANGPRIVYLEIEQSRLGAATDRSSRYFRWDVKLSPGEIARSCARYGHAGQVRDLVPRRFGVSGRVIELAVVGSEGETVLKGLDIRFALGLKENLFVIAREYDESGAVARFVFTGKGWGHGVGLCQVGASGMARTGARYEQIIQHYYPGVKIETLY